MAVSLARKPASSCIPRWWRCSFMCGGFSVRRKAKRSERGVWGSSFSAAVTSVSWNRAATREQCILLKRYSENRMQKKLNAVVAIVGLLLVGTGTMLAQTAQQPPSPGTPVYATQANLGAQPTGVSDQDVAMLRADL